MTTVYIADAGPSEVVVYVDNGAGDPQPAGRYDRRPGQDADDVLTLHGWRRLRAWRRPHEAPDHMVAQITTWP
ncbi:MAG: hypothetical protein ACOC9R_01700 [bacterium]